MKHQTAFIIAAALTAFVVIFAAGITMAVAPKVSAFGAELTPTQETTATAAPTLTQAPSATATVVQPTATRQAFLSASQASKLALALAPQAKMPSPPELVNYKGSMAYEVILDVGAVYVDAFNGKVLFNGIGANMFQPPVPPDDPGPSDTGGGGGGDDWNAGNANSGNGQTIVQAPNDPPAVNPGPQGKSKGKSDQLDDDHKNDDHEDKDDDHEDKDDDDDHKDDDDDDDHKDDDDDDDRNDKRGKSGKGK